MQRAASLAAVLLLLLAPGAGAADWSADKTAEVDRLVGKFIEHQDGAIPAMSVAVSVDGDLKVAKGFGRPGAGQPVGAGTVYHIGSLTKQFTAAAVLHMLDSGARAPLSRNRLTLDTPMRDIFDGVERWTAKDEPPITLRSLLSMTSNLPNFTLHPPREVDPWGAVAMPKLLAALKQLPPHGWPNTFEYSNTSYFLLARTIDAVLADEGAQASSRDYMRSNILRPANLMHTGFVGEAALGEDIAEPHYRRRPAFAQPHWLDGCGDMTSNVIDLSAWNKALMEGRIISDAARRLMFSDAARVDPVTYYGMGWFIAHDDVWDSYYHSGSVPGYTAYNAIQRHQDGRRWMSVTLLTNSDGIQGLDQLADEIFDLLRTE